MDQQSKNGDKSKIRCHVDGKIFQNVETNPKMVVMLNVKSFKMWCKSKSSLTKFQSGSVQNGVTDRAVRGRMFVLLVSFSAFGHWLVIVGGGGGALLALTAELTICSFEDAAADGCAEGASFTVGHDDGSDNLRQVLDLQVESGSESSVHPQLQCAEKKKLRVSKCGARNIFD